MTDVVWTAHARVELRAILDYLRERSPRAAGRLAQAFLRQTARLARFPRSGRTVPELPDWQPPLRELIVSEHRLVYMVRAGRVEIVSVFHARRDLPKAGALPH